MERVFAFGGASHNGSRHSETMVGVFPSCRGNVHTHVVGVQIDRSMWTTLRMDPVGERQGKKKARVTMEVAVFV